MAECSKTLVVNQASWKPYMYRDQTGAMAGLDYELIKGILDQAGCDYVFVEHPSKRALVGLENGEVDLVTGASITPERQRYGRFTRSYRPEEIVLVTRAADRDRLRASSLQELMSSYPVVLGAVNGGYYGEEYGALDQDSLYRSNRLILVQDVERLIGMLELSRIDAIVGDAVSLHVTAGSLGLGHRIAVHRHRLSSDVVHLLLSAKSTTLEDLKVIDEAIESYVNSEAYRSLMRRYGFSGGEGADS
ncbi:substrate-binding periplasmic protein [Marinobacter zhejiangensis]|nr:transporter substrate-binding domain-containing protein [Marinobacter zhejiangensis]